MMVSKSRVLILAAMAGCGSPGVQQSGTKAVFLPTTHGINYQPELQGTHADFISSAPLQFDIRATAFGNQLAFSSEQVLSASSCSGPCNASIHSLNNTVNTRFVTNPDGVELAEADLHVLRFAQYGTVDGPIAFQWLVVMEEGDDHLGGKLRAVVDREKDTLVYPAEVELDGKMVVTIKLGGGDAVRLRSRKKPLFRGSTPSWPPNGMTLSLANPPIEYFRESELDSPTAAPFMVVSSNEVRLGDGTDPFFEARPDITSVRRGPRGVRVVWSATDGAVGSVALSGYRLYRNDSDGEVGHWRLIATSGPASTSFVDGDGRNGSIYAVTHTTEFPFGFHYEGLAGQLGRVGQ